MGEIASECVYYNRRDSENDGEIDVSISHIQNIGENNIENVVSAKYHKRVSAHIGYVWNMFEQITNVKYYIYTTCVGYKHL